jgi:hypothetical protein
LAYDTDQIATRSEEQEKRSFTIHILVHAYCNPSVTFIHYQRNREALLTEPDAWKKNVSDIVSQKNQEAVDAAKREQSRKDHVIAELQKARELLQGQPQEGFREFASYLESQGETVAVRHGWDDAKGPWIGVDVSDKKGLIMDVVLQARIGAGEQKWFWVYEHRGNRRMSLEQEAESDDPAPSKQYVIESLADHYQKASVNRR